MNLPVYALWSILGASLIIGEFLIPGLVAVFVGLGALTVALFLYLHWIETVPVQLIVFFISSTLYIFTLRLLVVRLYPSDSTKQNIDEIQESVGRICTVSELIPPNAQGRIHLGESTWPARGVHGEIFEEGSQVRIVGRDNITWLVEKI